MYRRELLSIATAFAGAVGCRTSDNDVLAAEAGPQAPPEQVTIAEFNSSGERTSTVTLHRIVKSEREWRGQLSARAYAVTREKGTEVAFTGRYDKHYEDGIYRCVCCDTALFSSETKFNSHTGWPSFWAPIAEENVYQERVVGFGMIRQEVLCTRCDAHLGHVFNDGPPPTRLRYCMNSAALTFEAAGS